jgi:uncharacterized protein YkwD
MTNVLKYCIAVCCVFFIVNATAQQTSKGLAKDVFFAINEYRKQKQLNTLVWSENASIIAAQHSKNMASNKVAFSHTGFVQRCKAIYKLYGNTGTAENIIMGVNNGLQALSQWQTSAGHNKNILGTYTFTGIGVAKDAKGYFYITQIFIQ